MFGVLQHQMNMYKCLSAIMHLGNVDFSENDAEQSSVRTKPKLQVVAVSENGHCTSSSSAQTASPVVVATILCSYLVTYEVLCQASLGQPFPHR